MKFDCIILGAGKGTRMKSDLPKVLHKVSGSRMIDIVNDVALLLGAQNIVNVVSDDVVKNLGECEYKFVIQEERLGTGHAVRCAIDEIEFTSDYTMILYADTPLVQKNTLQSIMNENFDLVIAGFEIDDTSKRYGRIFAEKSNNELKVVSKIVEFKDANDEEKANKLCNSGVMFIKTELLKKFIKEVQNNNAQNEYYLTDLVEIFNKNDKKCGCFVATEEEFCGVNSRLELAFVDNLMQKRIKDDLMANGVTINMPESTYIELGAEIENDVIIEPFVNIGKNVKIKKDCKIKSFSHLKDVVVEK